MLTEKQQAILDFIDNSVKENGFPPSIREIARQFGVSIATVQDHVSALERKGFLQKKRYQSRSLSVSASSRPAAEDVLNVVPIIGRVAAGMPLLAQENIEEVIQLPKDWAPAGAFLLKVQGNSMEGAHILDRDYVLVHPQKTAVNGEIVVALIGEEATVKRFYRNDLGISLKAENPAYRPIEIERSEAATFKILGKVIGVLRVTKR